MSTGLRLLVGLLIVAALIVILAVGYATHHEAAAALFAGMVAGGLFEVLQRWDHRMTRAGRGDRAHG